MIKLQIIALNGDLLPAGTIGKLNLPSEISWNETTEFIQAVKLIDHINYDIIIADLSSMGDKSCSSLRRINNCGRDSEIILIVPEDFQIPKLAAGIIVLYGKTGPDELICAIQRTKSHKKLVNYKHQLDLNFERFSREVILKGGQQIIGVSKAVKSIAGLILLVSQAEETSVMVTGESGTGKELVARGIHALSVGSKNSFHAVNCSAIPDSLFESEFFGYRKGAFTGALEKSTGWFELSDHGTLFLDEVTELPLCMQSKFLRVLDDKTIHRIGSHQEVKLDLRVISATNQNIEHRIGEKSFREDLYHRLNSFHIHIPPLRERREDIPVLLNHFVEYFSGRIRKPVKPIDDNAMNYLFSYEFPGNVRELKNLVEGAVILSEEKKLMLKHFTFNRKVTAVTEQERPVTTLNLYDLEKNAIITALNQSKNNKSEAARLLSISRQSLDRRLSRLQIA